MDANSRQRRVEYYLIWRNWIKLIKGNESFPGEIPDGQIAGIQNERTAITFERMWRAKKGRDKQKQVEHGSNSYQTQLKLTEHLGASRFAVRSTDSNGEDIDGRKMGTNWTWRTARETRPPTSDMLLARDN